MLANPLVLCAFAFWTVALCFTVCSDGGLGNLGLCFFFSFSKFSNVILCLGRLCCGCGRPYQGLWRSFALCPEQCLFQVLHDQNRVLRRELQRLRLQLQESRAEGALPAAGELQEGSVPILSAAAKFPLDPSLQGSVGRLLVPELLLPVVVLRGK